MATSPILTFVGEGLIPAYSADAQTMAVVMAGCKYYAAGTVIAQVQGSGTAVNEVQTLTITGTPTGGTFVITFDGQTTTALAYNASTAVVQAALQALPNIGSGNVTVAGGALPGTAITMTFVGEMAGKRQTLATVYASLTGGTSPAAAITLTTTGKPAAGYWDSYDDALSDGREIARALLRYPTRTDGKGRHYYGTEAVSDNFYFAFTAEAYYKGVFYTANLVGIDANGVADLGKMVSGVTSALTAAVAQIKLY